MENLVVRRIASHEVEIALALALEVFMQFEAPDYGPAGVETFKRDIVENPEYLANVRQGICPIYGAFDGDKLVALMGMRSSKTHINLVFTKKEYHRKGIARAIFHYLLNDILAENPALDALTLNASPYGLPFYLKIGFVPQSEEQTINGIRFTPMKYIIHKRGKTMTVRNATWEDMALVAEIMATSFRTAFADFVSPETMDACTNPENCRAMLEHIYQEGKMHFLMGCNQGFLCWQETAEDAEIVAIHSLPESWGTGLGHAMLTEALKQIGNRPVYLWAFKENTRARRFYEKHGFHWDGSERVSEFDGAWEVRYVRKGLYADQDR